MEIRSKALGAIIAIVIFGGIMGASALGLWKTESVRNPAKLQISESIGNVAGENAGTGTYDPADIRGNHRFGEISEMFAIPLGTLSRAFALPATVDPATFQIQDFESIYPEFDGEQEIGNGQGLLHRPPERFRIIRCMQTLRHFESACSDQARYEYLIGIPHLTRFRLRSRLYNLVTGRKYCYSRFSVYGYSTPTGHRGYSQMLRQEKCSCGKHILLPPNILSP